MSILFKEMHFDTPIVSELFNVPFIRWNMVRECRAALIGMVEEESL